MQISLLRLNCIEDVLINNDKMIILNKNKLKLLVFKQSIFFGLGLLLSCEKKELTASSPGALPVVESVGLSEQSSSSVKTGCIIRSEGRSKLIEAGVCWGTSSEPTISNKTIKIATNLGFYTTQITGLEPGTTYFLRAFATNSLGTSYGNEFSFTTLSSWKEVNNAQLVIGSYNPSMASAGDVVFIHDIANRVYRSVNNGDSWELYNNGLTGMSGKGLMTIAQQSLIIVENDGNAYASGLNSNSWKSIAPPMTGNEVFETVTSAVIKDNQLVVSKPNYGVYKVALSGGSWSRINSIENFANPTITYLAVKDNVVFASATNYSRFYSSNDLDTWVGLSANPFGSRSISTIAVNGEDIYLGSSNGTYLSQNNGLSWTETDVNTGFFNFMSYAFGGSYIVASTSAGFKLSTNKGLSWVEFYQGLPGPTTGYTGLTASSNYFFTVVSKSTGYKLYRTRY